MLILPSVFKRSALEFSYSLDPAISVKHPTNMVVRATKSFY